MRFSTLFLAASVVVLAGHGAPVAAQTALGTHGDWSALTSGAGKDKVCYIASAPKKEEGKYSRRGDTFVLVSHGPGAKARDVIEVRAGYTYEEGSEVEIAISGKVFKLFTKGDGAWARDTKADKALAAAMVKGRAMVVTGVSSRGTETADTYSLTGFTAAYLAIGKACGIK